MLELTTNIAATEVQMGETQLQILQSSEFQNEVVNELGQVQTFKDLNERITALRI